jgi:L-cysteine S-thiosulfotransferase
MQVNRRSSAWSALGSLGLSVALIGCASLPSSAELDAQTTAMVRADFRSQGIADVRRIEQDLANAACSRAEAPDDTTAQRIRDAALASVKWPAGGQYLGDWREGERIAQSGRGLTWTDPANSPNGGNCYNCHQISKAEISFGTIGPSLYQYGKLRGITDVTAPTAEPIVQYTWVKLWNGRAYAPCSSMPRFGHAGILNEEQIRHVMALLLDPRSPVNAQ